MKKNDFFAVLIGCLLILGLSQVTYALYQGSNPWPMWRYDQTHGGHTTSTVTDRNVTIWDSASYYPQTPPIVADGQVIFGGTGPRMYALDETTGVELWRSFNLVGTVTGCPAFSDGRIFVATQSGYLYCINASTGVKIWENQLISSPGQIQSAPAVANGKVFVTTTDNYLFGVDIVTGQYGVWYFQAGGKIYSSLLFLETWFTSGAMMARSMRWTFLIQVVLYSYGVFRPEGRSDLVRASLPAKCS